MSDPSIDQREIALRYWRVNFGVAPRDPRGMVDACRVYFHEESEIAGGRERARSDIIIAMTGGACTTFRGAAPRRKRITLLVLLLPLLARSGDRATEVAQFRAFSRPAGRVVLRRSREKEREDEGNL